MNDEVNTPEVQLLLTASLQHPDNQVCADCTARQPMWAVRNIGIWICIKCSGVHRSMGTDISVVRSAKMDAWDRETVRNMRTNVLVNEDLEFHVPLEFLKPNEFTLRGNREKYIQAKYRDRLFEAKGREKQPPVLANDAESKEHEQAVGLLETSGILMITLFEGANLKAGDLNGYSDPYCIFLHGKQKAKSKTKKTTLNPNWKGEKLSLCIQNRLQPLRLEVWDWDSITDDDPLGNADIEIGDLVDGKSTERWVKLDTQGKIRLQLMYAALDH